MQKRIHKYLKSRKKNINLGSFIVCLRFFCDSYLRKFSHNTHTRERKKDDDDNNNSNKKKPIQWQTTMMCKWIKVLKASGLLNE